jgi:hypothetical protein
VLDRWLTAAPGLLAPSDGAFVVGREPFAAGAYFRGAIDDLMIFDRVPRGAKIGELAGRAPGTPAAPALAGAQPLSGNEVRVDWLDLSEDETSFRIEKSKDHRNWEHAGQAKRGDTAVIIGGLEPSTEYTSASRRSTPSGTPAAPRRRRRSPLRPRRVAGTALPV